MTIPFVRPDVAAFLAAMHESGAPPLESLPVPEARAMMRQMSSAADAPPVLLAVVRDLEMPGPAGPIGLRLYDRRATRTPGPLIVFYHGGGFVVGGLDSHDPFCSQLADQIDLPVLAVDYRLAPEHPFPAAPDDAEAAARWAAVSPEALGRQVTALITCGDSAGGNLAIVVAMRLAAQAAAVPVTAQWAIYPYIGPGRDWPSVRDFGEGYMITRDAMEWFDGHYGSPGDDPRHNCLVAQIPADIPLLVHTASLDPLRDQGVAYADAARAAGAEVTHIEAEGVIHGFINLGGALPSAQAEIDAFIAAARASVALELARP